MIRILIHPAETGTARVRVSFADEAGVAKVPISIKWTLSDPSGTVINSRRAVPVSPASSVSWLISGNDLAVGTYGTHRVLTVDALYNSTIGTNVPLRGQAAFSIEKYVMPFPGFSVGPLGLDFSQASNSQYIFLLFSDDLG